jgi:hypothetical protein
VAEGAIEMVISKARTLMIHATLALCCNPEWYLLVIIVSFRFSCINDAGLKVVGVLSYLLDIAG